MELNMLGTTYNYNNFSEALKMGRELSRGKNRAEALNKSLKNKLNSV
jgi:hypothetical protein